MVISFIGIKINMIGNGDKYDFKSVEICNSCI